MNRVEVKILLFSGFCAGSSFTLYLNTSIPQYLNTLNTPPTRYMLTPELLASSVIAVPPLARSSDYKVDATENRKIIRYLEAGGISILLYGGNANFYHIGLDEYEATLRMLAESVSSSTCLIPSAGPSFGMMMAQAKVLKSFDFPSTMVLPPQGAATSAGIATGIRRFAETYGKPVVLYIKHEGGLLLEDTARLMDDSVAVAIKYAIVRPDPTEDAYLKALLDQVDRRYIISGIGEQPAIVHMRDFGLIGFTSGCVCITPQLSQEMLIAIQAGNFARAESIRQAFSPLEAQRNEIHPVRVLHEAVRLAGIADTGPLLPLMSNLEPRDHERVQNAALELKDWKLNVENF